MNDPMTILKADHREAKKLLTALGESEEGPERDKMAVELEAALTLHMQIEEEILYPCVAEFVGEEDEEEAEIEHDLARDGLSKMLSMWDIARPDGPAEWKSLSSVLDERCADIGRDPGEIRRSVHLMWPEESDPAEMAETAAEFGAAGVDLVIFSMRAPYKAARLEPLVNALRATTSR